LRSRNDKLALRTFFSWADKDTAVWDAYATAWRSMHQDRRCIPSSTENQLCGWTSWYLHYENINEHIVLDHLSHFTGSGHLLSGNPHGGGSKNGWPAKVFQIDDGYTVVGDWLDYNLGKFPRGMAFIADQVRSKGLIPGLWLAPFLASKTSKIVSQHPDWFLKIPTCGNPSLCTFEEDAHVKKLGWDRVQNTHCCFGFHNEGYPRSAPNRSPSSSSSTLYEMMLTHPAFSGAYALDIENAEVRSHLAHVFRVVTREWGFKMLKLDFLFAAAQVARNGKTRGQLMWEAMQMVRGWAGPDTVLLGCGVPLGSSFMVVDYCRIGCDVGASWDTAQRHFHDREYISCVNSLTSTLSRWALSGRFFGNDPDVFFIRDWRMGLTLAERKTLMLLNHLLGHLVFCSDPFDTSRMSSEQQTLLSLFYPWTSTPGANATIGHEVQRVLQPLPQHSDVYTIQVQGGKDKQCMFILVANLSSRAQYVCLNVMDRILSQETMSMQPEHALSTKGSSVYFNADTGQLGSSAAAYWIKPRETSVFLRVMDSAGRFCGPNASVSKAGYGSAMLKRVRVDEPVYLVATKGGHVLPTTEIKSFEQDATYQDRLTIRFWPSMFTRTVTIWLAWQSSGKVNKRWTLNGQPLELCPQVILGSGMNLAKCTLCVHPQT
jgi:hypothetical protein